MSNDINNYSPSKSKNFQLRSVYGVIQRIFLRFLPKFHISNKLPKFSPYFLKSSPCCGQLYSPIMEHDLLISQANCEKSLHRKFGENESIWRKIRLKYIAIGNFAYGYNRYIATALFVRKIRNYFSCDKAGKICVQQTFVMNYNNYNYDICSYPNVITKFCV